jgi:aryl-alcohol dehydrogenase-like predicted oxidoreductase
MELRDFGKTGLRVSVLGFGGSEIGHQQAPSGDVNRLLNEALDAGLNVIDTAECYRDSEEKIGAAVSHRRRDFHLFTKVGHPSGDYSRPEWSAQSIAASIDRSLQRLRTDCVDLVQLHSCKTDILERGEATAALEAAKKAGKTRFIGYSGDGDDALYAVHTGRFSTLQTSISIADQQVLDKGGVLEAARERGMGVIAKRPIANAAWRHEKEPVGTYSHEYWKRLQELKYAFLSRSTGDAAAIALRFTLSQEGVHTAIVGTTKPGRWLENARALEKGKLPAAEIEAIRARWIAVANSDWVGQV